MSHWIWKLTNKNIINCLNELFRTLEFVEMNTDKILCETDMYSLDKTFRMRAQVPTFHRIVLGKGHLTRKVVTTEVFRHVADVVLVEGLQDISFLFHSLLA